MKNTPLIYLAGPIAGSGYKEITDWRRDAALQLSPLKTLNPMRAKEYMQNETENIHNYQLNTVIEHALGSAKGIVARDRNDVMSCDAVLMNLTKSKSISIGSMIEIGWADAFRKPLVLIIDQDNLHIHPMVLEMAGFVVTTLEEGVEVVKALFA